MEGVSHGAALISPARRQLNIEVNAAENEKPSSATLGPPVYHPVVQPWLLLEILAPKLISAGATLWDGLSLRGDVSRSPPEFTALMTHRGSEVHTSRRGVLPESAAARRTRQAGVLAVRVSAFSSFSL